MISSFFDANEGPRKLVLLPFRPPPWRSRRLLDHEIKVQLTPLQKANSATRFRPLSGLGFAPSESDGDAEKRSEGFHFLAVSLPLGTKLQNSMQPNLGSKNRLSVPWWAPLSP